MNIDAGVRRILKDAEEGKPINKIEAETLLALPANSPEAAAVRSAANVLSRRRFSNMGLLLGQIGVDMAPCEGNCASASSPSRIRRSSRRSCPPIRSPLVASGSPPEGRGAYS